MRAAPDLRIAAREDVGHGERVDEPLIHCGEVVALLFSVSDIAVTLTNIERLLGGDDEEEEADES
jgi:hypothetical protein